MTLLGVAGVLRGVGDLVRAVDEADQVDLDRRIRTLNRMRVRLIRGRGIAQDRDRGRWRRMSEATIDEILEVLEAELDRLWQARLACERRPSGAEAG